MIHRFFLTHAVVVAGFVTAGLWTAPSSCTAAEHTKDSIETVKKNLTEKKALLIDVREQREWDAGHLKWASLVPLSKLRTGADQKEFANELAERLPKEKIIYCHCRSGGRVLPASDILRKLGYDIRPLKHGYENLLEAGFPKAKDQDK